jgi:hypothetical protein
MFLEEYCQVYILAGPSEQSEGAGAPEAVDWVANYTDGQSEVGSIAARCMAEQMVDAVVRFLERGRS